MKKFILGFLLFIASTPLFASESKLEKDFPIKANTTKVQKWIETHRDKILKGSGCTILSRNDDRVKLARDTPRGHFEFTIEESSSVTKDVAVFTGKLIESHEGGIAEEVCEIHVAPHEKGKSFITVKMRAKVNNSNVSAADIRIDLNKSIRGIRKTLEENLE